MNNNLKYKLFNYKEPPSKDVWERISESLSNTVNFPGKLYNYTCTPPALLWDKIARDLDEIVSPLKPVHVLRKKKLSYGLIIAAAILIFLVVGASILLQKQNLDTTASVIRKPTISTPKQQITSLTVNGETKNNNPVKSHITYPTNKKPIVHTAINKIKRVIQLDNVEENELPAEQPNITTNVAANIPHADLSLADKFMVYTSAEGNHLKVPKKLFSLVHCDTEDYSCKQNLQNLQQKVSSASFSADFGGFIDMLKQLQENH